MRFFLVTLFVVTVFSLGAVAVATIHEERKPEVSPNLPQGGDSGSEVKKIERETGVKAPLPATKVVVPGPATVSDSPKKKSKAEIVFEGFPKDSPEEQARFLVFRAAQMKAGSTNSIAEDYLIWFEANFGKVFDIKPDVLPPHIEALRPKK